MVQASMTHRERLGAVLSHTEPDRVCIDFAGGQTGMGAGAVWRLRHAVLGDDSPVRITEPYQMLGDLGDDLREALALDVVGIHPRMNLFGTTNEGSKPFTMHDGTPVLFPEGLNCTIREDGAVLVYPEGDLDARPSGIMPVGSLFFDSIERQEPIVEERLNPLDNCEEFGLLSDADIDHFVQLVDEQYASTDYGIYLTFPGAGFGDIALVPAPWLKNPRGIRSVTEWYISTLTRRDYVLKVFEIQCEFALRNVERLATALGDRPQVVFVSGTDLGHQQSTFCSAADYRVLYKPFHKAVNDRIHRLTPWKTFIHTCGSVYDLIPDLIDAGFDVLNPVQCSAAGMSPERLKREFGSELVFWGGGVDTQKTLPFGTPDEVYREVRERIDILSPGGGFVFNAIHNVQGNVPTDNILAMFKAVSDSHE